MTPTEERDYLRLLVHNLRPDTLAYNSEFYTDIYQNDRGNDPVVPLRKRIDFYDSESLSLVAGYNGTGKTTQLRRLEAGLRDDGHEVIFVDTKDYRTEGEPFDIRTMLILVAAAVSNALDLAEIPQPKGTDFFSRLAAFFKRLNISPDQFNLSVGPKEFNASLRFAISKNPSFRDLLRRQLDLENVLPKLKGEVDDYFRSVKEILRERMGTGGHCVLILDSLEQVHPNLLDQEEVFNSVTNLFGRYQEQLRIPNWHVIYTVPAWLRLTSANTAINSRVFPHLKLHHRSSGKPIPENHAVMRELATKRFPGQDLDTFFGDQKIPANKAKLDLLVTKSGGHPRDLLLLIRETVLNSPGPLPVTEDDVRRAISVVRRDFLPIAVDDARLLDSISRNPAELLQTTELREINKIAVLLNDHILFHHINDEDWYEVHPLLVDDVKELVQRKGSRPPGKKAAAKKGGKKK
jgi:hypothetical protein